MTLLIEATSDWSTADIADGSSWVKPEGGVITLHNDGSGRVGNLEISAKRAGIFKQHFDMSRVTLHLYLQTGDNKLVVDLGHGDDGSVRISSGVDTRINDRVLGDGQNRLRFTLALTRDARDEIVKEIEKDAKDGKAGDLRGSLIPKK